MWLLKKNYIIKTVNKQCSISCSYPRFFSSVHPEAEDGVQTDPGEGLECGGDAGVFGAHSFGPAGLH